MIYKNILFRVAIYMLLFAAPGIGNAAAVDVENTVKDEYNKLVSNVESDSSLDDSNGALVKAFDTHASKLLLKWEREAPEDIVKDIEVLNNCKSISCTESMLSAIDRLKSRGIEGRGAALKLVELLGSGYAILPPELFFWKSATEVRIEAANTLVNMNEAGAIALVYAYAHDFDDITPEYAFSAQAKNDKRAISYANRIVTSNQAIQSIFSIPVNSKNIKPRALWVALLLKSKPEDFIHSKTNAKSSEQEKEKVEIESGASWYDNEFLVALVIGAFIWFGIRLAK